MPINVDEETGRPWSNSGGGPLVAIPAELAGKWRGTLPPVGAEVPEGWTWGQDGGPVCDYDRICERDEGATRSSAFGGFGAVKVGPGVAIALDAELHTEWHATRDGGYFYRAAYDESVFDPKGVKDWEPVPGAPKIKLKDGRIFLFDSASEGAADPEEIPANDGVGVVALKPGTYTVDCGTDAGESDYVRFRRTRT